MPQSRDELLIVALAGGAGVAGAAAKAGLSKRTAFRRLEDPGFRARVAAARAELVAKATGRLADLASEAAEALGELLKVDDLRLRLGACRAILELGTRLRESSELDERISELERLARRKASPQCG
jgi:hypothetical protein